MRRGRRSLKKNRLRVSRLELNQGFETRNASKYLYSQFCHTGEGRYPSSSLGSTAKNWIPAFAGMTTQGKFSPVGLRPRAIVEGQIMATAAPQAERIEIPDDIWEAQEYFVEKGWSDGLPVIPPTEERVAKMLAGTKRKPDEADRLCAAALGAGDGGENCHQRRHGRMQARVHADVDRSHRSAL